MWEARPMARNEVPLVFGTAGHIDHGKTTLVRALTGVDCDRLDEEKRRGITIELGFAPLELPDGTTISLVDVPGHEKFIRQMVAGAAGIDAVLLVVAADEGVMPQTREHLEILQLLGIGHGLVVLTKTDRVETEFIELVLEDVKSLLKGTFLENAAIIPVSASSKSGIPELLKEIEKLSKRLKPRSRKGALFLPVDRAFPISGFGTVVTGTAYSGSVKVGDDVQMLPSGTIARVRSLEVHETGVTEAFAGQRTAVNLVGIPFREVHRGDVVCTPALFKPTRCLDVLLKALKGNDEAIKHWQRVRLHIGTSDLLCRVSLFDPAGKIGPGEEAPAQLVLEEPLTAAFAQGFVIRSYSPLETIGGGRVLFPYGWKPRNRIRKDSYIEMLKRLSSAETPDDRLTALLQELEILNLEEAAKMTQLLPVNLKNIALKEGVTKAFTLLQAGPAWLVSKQRLNREWESLSKRLALFHEKEPHLAGMTAEEAVMELFTGEDPRLGRAALALFQEKGMIRMSDARFALEGFVQQDESRYERQTALLLDLCRTRGFEMPTLEEAFLATGLARETFSELVRQLRENAIVHLVGGEHLLSKEVLENGIDILRKIPGDITLAAFRDLSGSTRKYALPFLEYLDSIGVTRRVGEKRVLRQTRG